MGLIVRREHVEKILAGEKTETRRTHKRRMMSAGRIYHLRRRGSGFFDNWGIQIEVQRTFEQRLGDVTDAQGAAEGFRDAKGFKHEWIRLNGSWNPETYVRVYRFKIKRIDKTRLLELGVATEGMLEQRTRPPMSSRDR